MRVDGFPMETFRTVEVRPWRVAIQNGLALVTVNRVASFPFGLAQDASSDAAAVALRAAAGY